MSLKIDDLDPPTIRRGITRCLQDEEKAGRTLQHRFLLFSLNGPIQVLFEVEAPSIDEIARIALERRPGSSTTLPPIEHGVILDRQTNQVLAYSLKYL
jgi:hypothetical protein